MPHSTKNPKPIRGRPRDKDADARILKQPTSGREIGFRPISMEAIAAEGHVARTKMYRRWPDKATVMTDASCGGRSWIALPELPGTLKSLQIQTYGH